MSIHSEYGLKRRYNQARIALDMTSIRARDALKLYPGTIGKLCNYLLQDMVRYQSSQKSPGYHVKYIMVMQSVEE